jgi:drug/metabolite transporter (DMT)-like permease
MARVSGYLRGVAWMCGTVLWLSLMALAARELAASYSVIQIVLVRNVVGFLVILAIVLHQGISVMRTGRIGLHIVRNAFHIVALSGWFYGIGLLPLAEVFVLELTLPIWVLLMAAPVLGERLTRTRLIAVGLGFAGILIVLRPGIALIDPVALVVLAAAAGFAAANVATKILTRTDSALTIVFWMFAIQLAMSIGPALPGMALPQAVLWPWIAAVGVTGIAAHYCTARALGLAESGIVIPLHYLRVPLIAWLGWLIYDERVDAWLWLGGLVIFIGAMINLRGEKRA